MPRLLPLPEQRSTLLEMNVALARHQPFFAVHLYAAFLQTARQQPSAPNRKETLNNANVLTHVASANHYLVLSCLVLQCIRG